MIIIIDAYNLLKRIIKSRDISEKERDAFIKLIKVYSVYKRHTVYIVFDGGPYEWVSTQKIGHIKVVYTGHHTTADEYIITYLSNNLHADLLLVSDDHMLNNTAAKFHKPSIEVQAFYTLVQDAVGNNKDHSTVTASDFLVKLTSRKDTELDKIMHEAAQDIVIKKEDTSGLVNQSKNKLSKEERILLQKLKKL